MRIFFKSLFTVLVLSFSINLISQNKVPLSHDVYDSWKSVDDKKISNNGSFISYEINPQEGDGIFYSYEVKSGKKTEFHRGKGGEFSPNSNFMVFKIAPQFDTIRKMKLNKVKKDKMPKDSMGIYIFETGALRKIPNLKSFKLAEEKSDWLAYEVTYKKVASKNDSLNTDSTKVKNKKKNKKKEKEINKLVMYNPITLDSIIFEDVEKYAFSKNGRSCGIVQQFGDSIDSVRVSVFHTQTLKTDEVFNLPGYSSMISIDEKGNQISFTYSNDTIDEKSYSLLYFNIDDNSPRFVVDTTFNNTKAGWTVSEFGDIYFNKDGSELYFGTAPKPIPKIKDTLTKDEKVSIDIWNWRDLKLQPQQLKELEREKKRSYVAVYFPENGSVIQLADSTLPNVSIDKKAMGEYSLAFTTIPYQRMTSWEASRYRDVYLINRSNGKRKLILDKVASSYILSPDQNNVVYYSIEDSTWNVYNIESNNIRCLTCDLDIAFYNELNDVPNEAYPYGFGGWTSNNDIILYDRYDLWKFNLDEPGDQQNITNGFGRRNGIRFRYVKLDREEIFVPKNMILSAFNMLNKDEGYYTIKNNLVANPRKLIMEAVNFAGLKKAKHGKDLIVTKSTFREFPDLYLSDIDFSFMSKLTDANPQQSDYLWGDVNLVDWVTFEGDTMDGLLYTPSNFDSTKKYPMLVYFYERYSDRLHTYYTPKPIRSVINFSYYTSNGYVIFVPDIKYKVGYPGASAYDCIVSGTQAMVDEYDFIDRKNIGIQGQSWGGYQVAYLVTRTNMFKAAMAGAPVSNMTSAYGGIRWGSGLSRAFQYEQTQSRIGGSLWDEMPLYLENSPLFYANRVETPLLIMHNDKDGAVPWYQGIELFNALRRLDKPVWMLVYNGAPHNLKRRADCKDLTIRMQQFFDHYLKGTPEPVWMKYGVPAVQKGKSFGYELVE